MIPDVIEINQYISTYETTAACACTNPYMRASACCCAVCTLSPACVSRVAKPVMAAWKRAEPVYSANTD